MDSTSEPRPPVDPVPGSDADGTVITGGGRAPPIVATSIDEIGRALEGHALGPYLLERFVGGGGMGAVFRAIDTTLDRVVAVKVLSRQQSSDADMLRRFKNEAQLAARLDHENIGRVHAVGADGGWHFIVFEFIEGTNLRDLVAAEGPLDIPRAIRFTVQVAEALDHAWERGVVHRDIKPSNIIVTPAGRARLVDMGLARLPTVSGMPDLTASGMTLGTFDYISPEQARDPRAADVRSDLYSLGCTLFFMLTGRPPFADGTLVQKLLQHQQTPAPDVTAERADVPPGLAAAVEKLLRKDPDERFQRPEELVGDLGDLAERLGIELDTDIAAIGVADRPPPSDRPARWPWGIPVALLLLFVSALWGWPIARRAIRREGPPATLVSDGTSQAEERTGIGRPVNPEPRVWRVVDGPPGDGDVATVGEAFLLAGDGDVIECAFTGGRDQSPVIVVGRHVTLRAVPGHDPYLRFTLGAADGEAAAAFTVSGGHLSLEDVGVRLSVDGDRGGSLFAVEAGAAIDCTGTILEVRAVRGGGVPDRAEPPLFVRVLGARSSSGVEAATPDGVAAEQPPGTSPTGLTRMRFSDVLAVGDGTFLAADAVTPLEIQWSGGRCVTGGRFLRVEGGAAGMTGTPIRLGLADGIFAAREGFAALSDSSVAPVVPAIDVVAERCRFVTPPGRGFLEQGGIGPPDVYRRAIVWRDSGGRYEGTSTFRRIDGAAEREEIPFSAAPGALEHETLIDGWREGEAWEIPFERADRRSGPDS